MKMEKSFLSFSKMKYMLLFLLATCVKSSLGGYTVEYVNNGSGIYFDPAGKAKVLSQPLELFTYVNLSFVETQLLNLTNGLKNADNICAGVRLIDREDYCEKSLELLTSSFVDCQKQCQNLVNLLSNTRSKRDLDSIIKGVEAGIGVAQKLKNLIGNPDNSKGPDMAKYDNYIKTLSENQETFATEFNNKLIGIGASMDIINGDVSSIFKNEAEIKSDLIAIRKTIESEMKLSVKDREFIKLHGTQINDLNLKTDQQQEILKEYGEILNRNNQTMEDHKVQIDNLNFKDKMLSLLMILETEINTFKRNLDNIVDSIVMGRKNILSTAVISHQQVYDQLSKNVHLISENDELLYHLTKSSVQSIIESAQISTFLSNGNLVYVLKIPLVNKMEFTLYKTIPFPMKVDSDTYAYLEPRSTKREYLLLSTNKVSYTHVSMARDCEKIKNTFMCKVDRLYSVGSTPTCETKLLTKYVPSLPDECEVKMLYGHVDIWHQMRGNRWMFIQSDKTKLTVDCRGEHQSEELIMGSGILSMPLNCTAKTSYVHLVYTGEASDLKSPQTFFTINEDDCCVSSKVEMMKNNWRPTKVVSTDIAVLKDHAYEYKSADQRLVSDGRTQSIIMYSSVTVLLIVLAFVLYKVIKCRKNQAKRISGCSRGEFLTNSAENRA